MKAPERKRKKKKRSKIEPTLLEHLRDHPYQTFNLVDLFKQFQEYGYEQIRNRIADLVRGGVVAMTGEIRPGSMTGTPDSHDYITFYAKPYSKQ